MKRSGFKQKSYEEVLIAKASRKSKTVARKKVKSKDDTVLVKVKLRPIKLLKKDLEKLSHDFVRERDSVPGEKKKGYCCSCGEYAEGPLFQAGHYRTSGGNGALLRYHPQNMHGQCRDCNCSRYNQENVKVEYARFMHSKYSYKELEQMRLMKQKTINADRYFYEAMTALYKEGDQNEIIKFLNSYL